MRKFIPIAAALLILILLAVLSIRLGAVPVPFRDIWSTLLKEQNPSSYIVHEIRIPRVIVGILAGFGLAAGGTILQSVLRNPLASPDVIGLIAPHIAQPWSDPGINGFPLAALIGADLMLLGDCLGRIVIIPKEVPVGIMSAVIGAPYFIYLLRRGRQRRVG